MIFLLERICYTSNVIKFCFKIYKYIVRKLIKFIYWILTKAFSAFGFNFKLVPYSDWSSTIYLLYKKNTSKNYNSLKQNNYFKFNVFSQESDLRADFKNLWDEEATRILTLFSLNKLFDKFDFFDLGANYGLYSLPFLKTNKVRSHIIVEPNPFLITCLEQTFSGSKAKIISKAITASNDQRNLLFNIQPFFSGGSTLKFIPKYSNVPLSTLQIRVDAMSYPEMFNNYKVANKAIIKIDIEGSEVDLLKDGFLDHLNKIYEDFILMIEYIPEYYSKDEIKIFTSCFSNYYCLPLTNLNYIRASKYQNFDIDFFSNTNSINKFYKINCGKGIDWFANEKNFLYSDLIFFSSKKLAENFMNL